LTGHVALAFVLLAMGAICLAQFGLRHIYGYRITASGVAIMLFGTIPVWRVPFRDIAEVRKTSWSQTWPFRSLAMFSALRLGNRVWGPIILIRRKTRGLRIILVTPDRPDEFINEARQHLYSAAQ
jgi:hypothetical protein